MYNTTNLPPIPSQFCKPCSSDTTNIPLSYVSYTNILHIVIRKYPILKTQPRAQWKPILSLAFSLYYTSIPLLPNIWLEGRISGYSDSYAVNVRILCRIKQNHLIISLYKHICHTHISVLSGSPLLASGNSMAPFSAITILCCLMSMVWKPFLHFAQISSCFRHEDKANPCYSILATSRSVIFFKHRSVS